MFAPSGDGDGARYKYCKCLEGYSGSKCESIVENYECNLECNGGTCMVRQNSRDNFLPYCKCPEGYTGQNCKTKIEICGNNEYFCYNGGECVRDNDWYTCKCFSAAGQNCEHEATSSCEDSGGYGSFCTNNGICKSFVKEGEQ